MVGDKDSFAGRDRDDEGKEAQLFIKIRKRLLPQWQTFNRLLGDFWETFGRLFADFQQTFRRLLADFWQTFGRLSADFWNTFS